MKKIIQIQEKFPGNKYIGIWKKWRQAPGFWQRFEGKISEDGKIIIAYWENSTDNGKNWKHDFDLTYKRKK